MIKKMPEQPVAVQLLLQDFPSGQTTVIAVRRGVDPARRVQEMISWSQARKASSFCVVHFTRMLLTARFWTTQIHQGRLP
jgi:hypothetical protein